MTYNARLWIPAQQTRVVRTNPYIAGSIFTKGIYVEFLEKFSERLGVNWLYFSGVFVELIQFPFMRTNVGPGGQ